MAEERTSEDFIGVRLPTADGALIRAAALRARRRNPSRYANLSAFIRTVLLHAAEEVVAGRDPVPAGES